MIKSGCAMSNAAPTHFNIFAKLRGGVIHRRGVLSLSCLPPLIGRCGKKGRDKKATADPVDAASTVPATPFPDGLSTSIPEVCVCLLTKFIRAARFRACEKRVQHTGCDKSVLIDVKKMYQAGALYRVCAISRPFPVPSMVG